MPQVSLAARMTILVLATVFQFGCASATGKFAYPPSWAPLTKTQLANGCPGISGTYSNHAIEGFPVKATELPSLTDIFSRMALRYNLLSPSTTSHKWPVSLNAISATIQLEPERLAIKFNEKNGFTVDLSFRRFHYNLFDMRYGDLFTCYTSKDSPRLRFLAEPVSDAIYIPYFYIGAKGTVLFLLKATDGSLIVQLRNESFGISRIVLGTHMKINSIWWRYPPMEGP